MILYLMFSTLTTIALIVASFSDLAVGMASDSLRGRAVLATDDASRPLRGAASINGAAAIPSTWSAPAGDRVEEEVLYACNQ